MHKTSTLIGLAFTLAIQASPGWAAVMPYGPFAGTSYDTVVNSWGWTEELRYRTNQAGFDFNAVLDRPHRYLMVGSLHDGTFNVLGAGERSQILVQTSGDTTRPVNGSEWYWNNQKAFGFAPLGESISLNDSEPHLDFADPTDPRRLSWTAGNIPGVVNYIHGESRSGTILDLQDQNWYNVVLSADDVSTFVSQIATPPPSRVDLAQASLDVYATSPSQVGQFSPAGGAHTFADGLKVQAYTSADGTETIFAIRGTDTPKNWITNAALGGISNAQAIDYLNEATAVMREVLHDHPGTHITLTGHSLGGALAQVLGAASGADATVFDSPGTQALWVSEGDYLRQIVPHVGQAAIATNYRLYGDQISLIGSQLGVVRTVGDETQICCAPTRFSDYEGIVYAHSIQLLATLLQTDSVADGITGPQPWTNLPQRVLLPLGAEFIAVVDIGVHYAVDPFGGDTFTFESSAGSPFLGTLTLPNITGVAMYDLSYRVDGMWSDPFRWAPGDEYAFGDRASGFRFTALDAGERPFQLDSFFLLDLTFSSPGTWRATIASTTSTVPEPATWVCLLAGLISTGTALRYRPKRGHTKYVNSTRLRKIGG